MSTPRPRPQRTPELAQAICDRISEGSSLRSVCRDEDMPSTSFVCAWLADDPAFQEQYARATEARADGLFEEILDIADDGSNDTYAAKDGEQVNYDHIQRSKLRVDARKWMIGKMAPKKYGDRLNVEHSGAIATMTEEQIDARLAELEQAKAANADAQREA